MGNRATCWLCGAGEGRLVADLRQKPPGESDFGIGPMRYRRCIYRCPHCRVYFSLHDLLGDDFYTGTYNKAVYQSEFAQRYRTIMDLPRERSDNNHRVRRIVRFLTETHGIRDCGQPLESMRVLDVGSGLCVFLAEMKKLGARGYCVDPDPVAVHHALRTAGVRGGHVGTLEDYPPGSSFDLITFNKVLEHVKQPVRLLSKAAELLAPEGIVYLELPDGDAALRHGGVSEREEFEIEHYTVFNRDSLRHLILSAGLACARWEAIHEPSDKYTLYAFCRRPAATPVDPSPKRQRGVEKRVHGA